MKIKRIRLKSLKNTRDLGGLPTTDGKHIRPFMLIRSGHLSEAAENDIGILIDKYNLGTVIDLRTDVEIQEKPEVLPENIEHYFIPLLDKSFLGIARDEYSIKSWFNVFSDSDRNPADVFCDMYDMLVFGDRSKVLIRQFFDILLNADKAVLWHCSAGKDRVGITTALLLLALGVDREVIIKDYLATRYFTAKSIIYTRFFGSFIFHKHRQRKCLAILMGVKRIYIEHIFDKIDNEYSGVNDFLNKQFGINEKDIQSLKNKYLM